MSLSVCLLPKADAPSTLREGVGTANHGYLRLTPPPRIPSMGHSTTVHSCGLHVNGIVMSFTVAIHNPLYVRLQQRPVDILSV